MFNHHNKEDRAKYYCSRNSSWTLYEFIKGCNHHYFRYNDLKNARVRPFNENDEDQENLLRSRLPLPIYASDHIIGGPRGDEFTGMIIIRFFDHYRPLLVPQVWWFEYYKPNESAELAGGLGKEN